MNKLPRFPLAQLPTPLEELSRLREALGGPGQVPRLLVKRDDQTGLALGGNKTRKLEYLIADALAAGADIVLTAGAIQSNHCRQTAAAAARAGLDCLLVLGGRSPKLPAGNLLLDHLLGAEIVWTGPERRGERLDQAAAEQRTRGRTPYVIPYGGSNPVGAAGYAVAIQEMVAQLEDRELSVDRIVVASSSGGTQAGMAVGLRATGFTGQLLGIWIDKEKAGEPPYRDHLTSIANGTASRLGLELVFKPGDFHVNEDYLGAGYAVVGALEREAVRLTARQEGLLLDPVYSGRAMGGLIDMIRRGAISPDEAVLFWHTGGAPALFAHSEDLL